MKSARSLRGLLVVFVLAGLLIGAAGAEAKPHKAKAKDCLPGQPQGAPGIGDEYYPTYGNGGYDVQRYLLDVAYDPATDVLDGKATIRATGDAERLQLQPRLRRARDLEDHRRRATRQPGPATTTS